MLFSILMFGLLLFLYQSTYTIESFVNNTYSQSNSLLNKLENLNAKWKNDLFQIQSKQTALNKVFILPNQESPASVKTLSASEKKNTMTFLDAIIKKWPKIRGNQQYVMQQNKNSSLTQEHSMVPTQVSEDPTFKDIDFPTAEIPSTE